MIKIGATEVDTIKIGSTDVDKVMLGGEQLYPSATGFAITSQPTAQTVEQPAPVSFTVGYIPEEATVQWQWHPLPFDGTDWRDIDDVPNGSNSDTYSKVSTSTAMDGENYRAVVSLAGEDDITSDPALLSVEQGDVLELTGDAKDFLVRYNPSDPRYQEDEKLFPRGRRMQIYWWSAFNTGTYWSGDAHQAMHDAGYTMHGPANPDDAANLAARANASKLYGTHHAIKFREGIETGGVGSDPVDKVIWLTENDIPQLRTNIINNYNLALQKFIDVGLDPDVYIEGWSNFLEERRNNEYAGLTNASVVMQLEIQKVVGKDQFISQPEPTGWSASDGGYTPNSGQIQGFFKSYGSSWEKQSYKNANFYEDGPTMSYQSRVWFWGEIWWMIYGADNITHNLYNYKPVVSPLLGNEYRKPFDQTETQEYVNKETASDIINILNAGSETISIYQWKESAPWTSSPDAQTKRRFGFNAIVSAITSANVTDAFLWGQRKTDISSTSPTSYTMTQGVPSANSNEEIAQIIGWGYAKGPKVSWSNIQLEDARYINVTNVSMTTSASSTLSGFPENGQAQAEVVFAEGANYNTGDIIALTEEQNGQIAFTFEPLGSAILKIGAAPGWIVP